MKIQDERYESYDVVSSPENASSRKSKVSTFTPLHTSLNFTVVICLLFLFIPSPSCRKEALFSSSESDFSALISQVTLNTFKKFIFSVIFWEKNENLLGGFEGI
jgi:hypothetical protein